MPGSAPTATLINPKTVRGALSAMRHAQSATAHAGGALHGLNVVDERLRRDGIVDNAENRAWALYRILDDVVVRRLEVLRASDESPPATTVRRGASRARDGRASDPALDLLARDVASGSIEREALGLLAYRFLVLAPTPIGELPDALGISRRTMSRRLSTGLRLVADALRQLEEAHPPPELIAAQRSPVERIEISPQARHDVRTRALPQARVDRRKRHASPHGGARPANVLAAALADGGPIARLSIDELQEVARRPALDLRTYLLGRVAQWCDPNHRLHRRFVRLGLLLDRGPKQAERWQRQSESFDSVAGLIDAAGSPALVLLGPPGSGKSTLLRYHELQMAVAGVRGESDRIPFAVQLNTFPASASPPSPRAWLIETWQRRYGALPPLESLLAEGRVTFLLDGLNEMRHEGPSAYARLVTAWRLAVGELTAVPGNRVVFTCRSLDYSSPLSSETISVPQARLDALDDEQIRAFLAAYVPGRAAALWEQVEGSTLLEVIRRPFALRLLIDLAAANDGADPAAVGEAALVTRFVRRALAREIERDSPALLPGALLDERERRALVHPRAGADPHWLPTSGPLVRALEALAFGMQAGHASNDGGLVSIQRTQARQALREDLDEGGPDDFASMALDAGHSLGLLDEDPFADSISFAHQRFQEYFSARRFARQPEFARLRRPWRASEVEPDLRSTVEGLPPGERLPPLPSSGWLETARLAAQMSDDPPSFVAAMAEHDLVAAATAAKACAIPAAVLDPLRRALVRRSRDVRADVRARIEAARALGRLGDPRFAPSRGAAATYVEPPMIRVEAGTYVIGHDEPSRQEGQAARLHIPSHPVTLDTFEMARFPLTNAEWRHFQDDGGYDDPRWWGSETARAFRAGENTTVADRMVTLYWVEKLRQDPERLAQLKDSGAWPEETCNKLEHAIGLGPDQLEDYLAELYPGRRLVEPRFWRDPGYNHPSQPVTGICLCEAQAYAAWLSARSGACYRVPTEVQWEAAARGLEGRRYPTGDEVPDPFAANAAQLSVGRPTPVGIFPESDTPEGIADLAGNVLEMTRSGWGHDLAHCAFGYPYDPHDGRESSERCATDCIVMRGTGYGLDIAYSLTFQRYACVEVSWARNLGVRLVREGR